MIEKQLVVDKLFENVLHNSRLKELQIGAILPSRFQAPFMPSVQGQSNMCSIESLAKVVRHTENLCQLTIQS